MVAMAIGWSLVACASPAEIELAGAADSKLVGLPAQEFSLEDQDGNTVSLSGLRDQWVVLYFYSDADTPGCKCDATKFTQVLVDLGDIDVTAYGIGGFSTMNNKYFIEKYALGVDLLSDMDHEAGYLYGACAAPDTGSDEPVPTCSATVIVGPDGVVRYHWPMVVPKNHVRRVRDKLAELQAAPQ